MRIYQMFPGKMELFEEKNVLDVTKNDYVYLGFLSEKNKIFKMLSKDFLRLNKTRDVEKEIKTRTKESFIKVQDKYLSNIHVYNPRQNIQFFPREIIFHHPRALKDILSRYVIVNFGKIYHGKFSVFRLFYYDPKTSFLLGVNKDKKRWTYFTRNKDFELLLMEFEVGFFFFENALAAVFPFSYVPYGGNFISNKTKKEICKKVLDHLKTETKIPTPEASVLVDFNFYYLNLEDIRLNYVSYTKIYATRYKKLDNFI